MDARERSTRQLGIKYFKQKSADGEPYHPINLIVLESRSELNPSPNLDQADHSKEVNKLTPNLHGSKQGQANGVPIDHKPRICRNKDKRTVFPPTLTLFGSKKI